ncbi:hypothetical protein H6G14_22970 [Nostoc parmelioides FACHB-3921]|uniref:Uncharacterized protein n=1 Tax=Nostoc parmelioides FACHB-3921 TaxID=2692909 RepID=A0ABR8BJP4_9NOSO|nr:hypothetical protein [Nostoc parmelioides FACHB-3921]
MVLVVPSDVTWAKQGKPNPKAYNPVATLARLAFNFLLVALHINLTAFILTLYAIVLGCPPLM